MGGVKTIDMRAHGTQKLWQKPCAHTKQKHKHMTSKTESLAMCKMGHEHAANNETHKPRVQNTKHESKQPVKNRSWVSHRTRQNKRKHAAEKLAVCNKTRQRMQKDRGVHGPSELETPRSHSKTKPGVWVSEPRHETRTEPETRQECRDPNTSL